jgi:hypothetical protein
MKMKQLRFLNHKKINHQKWDECIAQATCNLPYAYSWYLDAVAENWDGLIWGNYEAVMPLVWLRKWGVRCLYQPYYCQQGGVFSRTNVTPELLEKFLAYLKSNFLYVNLNLNHGNQLPANGKTLKLKKNLILELNDDYSFISRKFSENQRRNITKAIKKRLQFSVATDEAGFIKFYLKNVNREKENFKPQHEKMLKRLVHVLLEKGCAKIAVVSSPENEWLAASVIIHHRNRLINIINTSSVTGKSSGASHLLFSEIIRVNTGKDLIFDFEGSSIASIARFYEGFGAQEENFLQLKHVVGGRFSQLFL